MFVTVRVRVLACFQKTKMLRFEANVFFLRPFALLWSFAKWKDCNYFVLEIFRTPVLRGQATSLFCLICLSSNAAAFSRKANVVYVERGSVYPCNNAGFLIMPRSLRPVSK